jgi:hypothetical protein
MTNGGKRPGAGRPPAADPASKLVTVRMTTTQHAKFIELGGSRWVKSLLDNQPDHEKTETESPSTEQLFYRIPLTFWLDHSERYPCDHPGQLAEEVHLNSKFAVIRANAEQLECLRSDAEFYSKDNVDDCKSIQRSARATLIAIAKGNV